MSDSIPRPSRARIASPPSGAGVKEIMYRIGHSSPQAALRYQHATQRRDRSIADGISKLIKRERADSPESQGHD